MRVILCLVMALACAAAPASETDERDKIRQQVVSLVEARDHRALTILSAKFRTSRARTSSGLPKLDLFYQGIDEATPESASADDEWQHLLDFVDHWHQLNPAEPAPYIAKARIHMSRAWAYRGEGFVSSVGKWDMLRYRQESKLARDWLVDNKKAASADPAYYSLLVHALRAQRGTKNEVLATLYEGMIRYPDFDPIYFRGAGYLSPKWLGSHEELAEFAKRAVEHTKAIRGNEIYVRAYWAAGQGGDGKFYFSHHSTDRALLKASMTELVENYPAQWNINQMSVFACVLRDPALTRHFMEMLEEPVDPSPWMNDGNYDRCKGLAGLQ